jgi:hypothetical protein
MAYICTGTLHSVKKYWNRKTLTFQDFACMDCVYPTMRGAGQVYRSTRSKPFQVWQALNVNKDVIFWVISQSEFEKQLKTKRLLDANRIIPELEGITL